MLIVPCKDCQERELGCHSRCEKYLNYRKEKDLAAENRLKFKTIDETTIAGKLRMLRLRKPGGGSR